MSRSLLLLLYCIVLVTCDSSDYRFVRKRSRISNNNSNNDGKLYFKEEDRNGNTSNKKQEIAKDFNCPEDFGYFPHEEDCTLYYVCVFGGALLESCTGGLMYSHELQTCDWPRNVYCHGVNASLLINNENDNQIYVERGKDNGLNKVDNNAYSYSPLTIGSSHEIDEIIKKQNFNKKTNQENTYDESNRLGRSYQGSIHGSAGKIHRIKQEEQPTRRLTKRSLKYTSIIPSSFYNTHNPRTEHLTTTNPTNYFTPPIHVKLKPTTGVINRQFDRGKNHYYDATTNEYYYYYQNKDNELQPHYSSVNTRGGQRQKPLTRQPSYSTGTANDFDEAYDYIRYAGNSTYVPVYEDEEYYIYEDELNVPSTKAAPSTSRQSLRQQTNTAAPAKQDYYAYYEDAFDYIQTTRRPVTTTSTTTYKPRTRSRYIANKQQKQRQQQRQQQQQQQQQYDEYGRGRSRTRGSRPTLKPSKNVISSATKKVRDVYLDAPSRPRNVYATPKSDSFASKCRRDKCVLPDCYCGGTPIPGDLPASNVPQLVLLTFDDSVNDLNKGLYKDLFEKGRTNPNGCPIQATFYVSHEWTDYSQVQNLAANGHEIASHSISHSFGEQFSSKKWYKEIGGQREILSAYGGVKLSEIRGMRAPFLAIGGNNMFRMLHDGNFTYDSSMPVYENRPPSWPYTLDYKVFHDCMIPPCPSKSYPGVWEVPMVMWQDLKGGRCSMGDACSNPPTAEGVYKMLAKNFERHYTTNRAPFGLYYHAAWFTQPHHKEGFEAFLDTITKMDDVWLVTNWQALQWVRNPTPISQLNSFKPFDCRQQDLPPKCDHPRVCNLWHKSGVRYMKTCQACPEKYPWTGHTGVPNAI